MAPKTRTKAGVQDADAPTLPEIGTMVHLLNTPIGYSDHPQEDLNGLRCSPAIVCATDHGKAEEVALWAFTPGGLQMAITREDPTGEEEGTWHHAMAHTAD